MNEDFERLVRTHNAMLYRIAFNFLRDVPAAEEVVQEVFLKLYQRLDTIESPERVAAWLRRTVTRQCLDVFKLRSRKRELPMEEVPELAAETPDSDALLNERMRRLVASLPEKQRMIVILRYGEDL